MLSQWRSQVKLQRCDSKPRKYVGSGEGERPGELQWGSAKTLESRASGSESPALPLPSMLLSLSLRLLDQEAGHSDSSLVELIYIKYLQRGMIQ